MLRRINASDNANDDENFAVVIRLVRIYEDVDTGALLLEVLVIEHLAGQGAP